MFKDRLIISEDEKTEEAIMYRSKVRLLARYIDTGNYYSIINTQEENDLGKELVSNYKILKAAQSIGIRPWEMSRENAIPEIMKEWSEFALLALDAENQVAQEREEVEKLNKRETMAMLQEMVQNVARIQKRLANPIISFISPTEDGGFVEFKTKAIKHRSLAEESIQE